MILNQPLIGVSPRRLQSDKIKKSLRFYLYCCSFVT